MSWVVCLPSAASPLLPPFSERSSFQNPSATCSFALAKGCSSDWNLVHPHPVTRFSPQVSPRVCVPPESPLCLFSLLHTFVSISWAPESQPARLYPSLSISFSDASGKELISPTGLGPPRKQGPMLGPPACPTEWGRVGDLSITLWVPDRQCQSGCTEHRPGNIW